MNLETVLIALLMIVTYTQHRRINDLENQQMFVIKEMTEFYKRFNQFYDNFNDFLGRHENDRNN